MARTGVRVRDSRSRRDVPAAGQRRRRVGGGVTGSFAAIAVVSALPEVSLAAVIGRHLGLRRKYADVPMDFADASLVVLAMREGMDRIVSLDSDFEIYRLTGKKQFRNLLPIR